MTNLKNVNDLRDEMLSIFEKLQNKQIDLETASIMAKISETIVSGAKTQIQYALLTNTVPSIPFLETPDTYKKELPEQASKNKRLTDDQKTI